MSKAAKTAPVTKEEVVEVEKETPVVMPIKKQKPQNVMYLGPTINGVVRHSTVFKDGFFTNKIYECIKELPVMEKLFVPMNELPKAINELKKGQSVMCSIYAQTENKFNKK